MIKLRPLIFENKILIPRRTPEERERNYIAECYKILQQYIKRKCEGELDLTRSPIKILPDNLIHAKGNLFLTNSKIEDLNNLERVDGYFGLHGCKNLKSLGKLKSVGGGMDLDFTNIESLENLEYVGSSLYLRFTSNLKSLGKLKVVNGYLFLHNSNILNVMPEEEILKQIKVKLKLK
jgi:hypothetical protein